MFFYDMGQFLKKTIISAIFCLYQPHQMNIKCMAYSCFLSDDVFCCCCFKRENISVCFSLTFLSRVTLLCLLRFLQVLILGALILYKYIYKYICVYLDLQHDIFLWSNDCDIIKKMYWDYVPVFWFKIFTPPQKSKIGFNKQCHFTIRMAEIHFAIQASV